ncbi:hypothetical protein [Acholeplasma granularum]|uniref:hypothetical protein n=1 Tax=Acholeplasma granularum TaxID=264635 RepID=UPI0004BBFC10|nr:hypothetical protein [Acholeplasma granularum]
MKTLIKEVLALDKQAQAKIESLKKEKNELFLIFKEMKEELSLQQKIELEKQTKQLEIDAKVLFDERLKQYTEKSNIKEAKILEQYEANKDKWLEDLMSFILGEEN